MVTIQSVIDHLEGIAPSQYQEGYDNAQLIVGDPTQEVTGVLTCLDSTEAVIADAVERGCNLVVAHHPIIFKGLKSLTGKSYVERTVIKAIREGVAIYAIHTNLDNVLHRGVNQRIGQRLGLTDMGVLAPKAVMQALQVGAEGKVLDALQADGGQWEMTMQRLSDFCLHLVFPKGEKRKVYRWLHAHGTPPESIVLLADPPFKANSVGAGLIGQLSEPVSELDFLDFVKERMQAGVIRHTALRQKPVERVALCGGSGGFLLPIAKAAGADIFLTADYKYHEFFDADGGILIADIGHFESEQYTINILQEILSEKFSNFATYCTKVRTNPVFYR